MSDEQQEYLGINDTGDTTTDGEIPEEQAIEQQIVPFLGDDLTAALTQSGVICKFLHETGEGASLFWQLWLFLFSAHLTPEAKQAIFPSQTSSLC